MIVLQRNQATLEQCSKINNEESSKTPHNTSDHFELSADDDHNGIERCYFIL